MLSSLTSVRLGLVAFAAMLWAFALWILLAQAYRTDPIRIHLRQPKLWPQSPTAMTRKLPQCSELSGETCGSKRVHLRRSLLDH